MGNPEDRFWSLLNITYMCMRQLMRFWHLSHMGVVKAQTSLHKCTVLSEPSLISYTKKGHRWRLGSSVAQ